MNTKTSAKDPAAGKVVEDRPGPPNQMACSTIWIRTRLRAHMLFLMILALVMALTFLSLFVYRWHLATGYDLMRLMAMARSISLSLPSPGGFQLVNKPLSPYILLLGLLWKATEATAPGLERIFAFSGLVGAGLFTSSLYLFCRFLGSPGRAAVSVATALFLWGPAQAFWAGVYSVVGMMYGSMLPQTYAYAIGLLCILSYLKYAETGERKRLVQLACLFWLVAILHLLTSIFVAVAIICVACLNISRENLLAAISLVAGGLGTLLWPFYSVTEAFADILPTGRAWIMIVSAAGLYLLAFMALVRTAWRWRRSIEAFWTRWHLDLALSLACLAWITRSIASQGVGFLTWPKDIRLLGIGAIGEALGPGRLGPARFYLIAWSGFFVGLYALGAVVSGLGQGLQLRDEFIWERFLFFGLLPLQLLLGMFIYDCLASIPGRWMAASACLALVGAAVILNYNPIAQLASRPTFLTPEIQGMVEALPPDSTVISDQYVSDILAGYYGVGTAAPVTLEEKEEVKTFFKLQTSDNELFRIAKKFSTNVVILHLPDPTRNDQSLDDPLELKDRFDKLFQKLGENGLYAAYLIDPGEMLGSP